MHRVGSRLTRFGSDRYLWAQLDGGAQLGLKLAIAKTLFEDREFCKCASRSWFLSNDLKYHIGHGNRAHFIGLTSSARA